ncbi:hypothetical protein WJX79_006862 [Trebouxia sp. C0005]
MQSPRGGLFSRVSQGFGFGKSSKNNQRDNAPTSATSEARRPPVGGGRHDDDEDEYPAAQTQQPSLVQREQQAQVQEGTEGSKAVGSQPASEFSEIQPASSAEDVSGQTVFATPYKNTAITKLMSETTGPSVTVPASTESSNSQAAYTPSPVRQQQPQVPHPVEHATHRSGPSLTTERIQDVAGFDKSSQPAPVQGQNVATGGFRSSSGVPSEDELNQLYANEAEAQGSAGPVSKVDTDTGDLPEDLNIGFSGKGPGIYGSFATGKSATPGPTASQAGQAGQGQGPAPSMMQLPESEELRTHHQPEGVGSTEAAPFVASGVAPLSQGGHHEAALGVQTGSQEEVPFGRGQPASLEGQQEREAVPTEGHGSNAAGSQTGSGIAGSIASYIPGTEANREARAEQGRTPDTFSSGNTDTTGGGVASYIPGTEANRMSRSEQDSGTGSNTAGSGSAGVGAVSYSDQQKPAGQGIQALAEGSEQYPATPERLNRQPHPASPEDVQGVGSAAQGSAPSGAAVTHEAEYNAPAHTVPGHEQEAPLSGSGGVTDIPNYPRENPLFDEEQQQQQQQQETEPEAAPKFYENPEFDSSGRSAQQTLASPMIPNRSSPQQQQTYDSPAYTEQQNQPQTAHIDRQAPAHSTAGHTSSVEIPPESEQEQHRYAVEQEVVAEPVVEVEAVQTAPPVPVEQEVVVRERELPTTYSGPQIVSKEADLTPRPPSAAWGPATVYAPYTAPPRAAPYVPPTQESVVVAQPVVETETVMVEQDPPIDPSVERAEPPLPVSTTTTGMLTSTPQLGPATTTAAPATVATTEIVPVTQETTVTQAVPLPTPMTREEITSYRPAQDPPIDPSQGQAPVQVSTNLAVEPRPAPPAPVMSTAEIAAYRSGEDPAYDPVERRGWWDVDMASGGGTILPATTRGPSRGRRGTTGTRGAGVRSSAGRGRSMENVGGAPGLYDAPPLGGRYASGAPLTPTPTPVAPLGNGETRDVPTTGKGLGQDPVYDPTEGASGSALPSAGNDQIDNPLFEEQQQPDISSTAYDQVESAPGLQKDVTHRGEQVGTPHFARQQQQQPSAFGAAPPSGDIVTRPVMGSTRRPPRTVNLADIGRPAPLPPVQEQQYEAPEPKPEFEMGGADVLPRDEHYEKPTPYDELGANARSALSGAGWKTKWAVEMEANAQRGGQGLKYPVGPVVPKGASGFAPKASTALVGEPDYAALARGEPGFTVPGADLQDTPPLGPPSSATGGVAPQPSYMQIAAPPVHPGAPVVDRGFTGPGGAAGGARRRLASKLFDRQHSLQDPSFDPVSQRFGRDEGYGVDLPVHKPPQVPTGRASAGLGSDQGVAGGPSRGSRASSQAGFGMRQPQYEEEEIIPEEQEIQEEPVPVVDKTKEMNERLLVEVRKRLQAAKSQLNSAPPSEADGGTPVDSPLGGRPTVLQNRTSEGTPGYWRTLEEVEAEGSNPMSRNAPSPWVQTHGPELVPRRLFQAGGASSGFGGAPRMRTGMISSGKVANKGLEGYGSGRVHNIAGGYPNRVSRGGNQYSWGREGVF